MQEGTTSATTAMQIDLCSPDSDSATESEASSSDLSTSDESSGYETGNDQRNGDGTSNFNSNLQQPIARKQQRFIASSDDEEEEESELEESSLNDCPNNACDTSNSKASTASKRTPKPKSKSVTKLTCLAPRTNKQQHVVVIDDAEIREKFSTKLYKLTRKTMENLYADKIRMLTARHVMPRCPQKLVKQQNLNIACGYAHGAGWEQENGFREMIQNWFDGCQRVANRLYAYPMHVIQPVTHRNNLAYYFFVYKDDDEFDIRHVANNELLGCILLKKEKGSMVLKLANYGIALDSSVIIMGQTSKRHGQSVGKFGEGLKMGACILLHWGHKFSILTNKKNWKFSFKKSKNFDNADPTMYVSPHQKDGNAPAQVIVTITNVVLDAVALDEVAQGVKQVNLCRNIERRHFFPLYYPRECEHIRINILLGDPVRGLETLDGHILFGEHYRHKIFSNGFFIDYDDDCFFGYNLNNRTLPLTRDRCLTGRGRRRLYEEIPKYWQLAMSDKKGVESYLEMVNGGKPARQYTELHPDHLHHFLNDETATLLFDNFLAQMPKYVAADREAEEEEEKRGADSQQIECTEYFIVSTEISQKDEEKIRNELRRTPYKIDKHLCAIFEQSHKFQTLAVALQRELNALSNASNATLSDAEKQFVEWFVDELKSLFPAVLRDDAYTIQFKETDMSFRCKIIDKNIIFKAKKLHLTDTNDEAQKESFFKHLLRGFTDQLEHQGIVSKDEVQDILIGGIFQQSKSKNRSKNELAGAQQRAFEMEQQSGKDGDLIEQQRNEIGELQKRLSELEKPEEKEIKVEPVLPLVEPAQQHGNIVDNDAHAYANSIVNHAYDYDDEGDYDPGYGWNDNGGDDAEDPGFVDEGDLNDNQLQLQSNIDRKRRFAELNAPADGVSNSVSNQSAIKRQRLNDVSVPFLVYNAGANEHNEQSMPAVAVEPPAVIETVQYLQTIINEKSEKLRKKDIEIVACTGEIHELKNVIAEMEAELVDLQKKMREMRLSCDSKDSLIAQQQKELEQLKEKIAKWVSVFQG